MHKQLHRSLIDEGIPYHGSKFTGSIDDFWNQAAKAYDGIETVGYLKYPGMAEPLYENLTPGKALEIVKELQTNEKFPKIDIPKVSKGEFSY